MKHLMKLFLATLFVAFSLLPGVAHAESIMGKTLIVYYSFTGNCEAIVNTLAEQITADRLEIEPAEKGLDYAANNYAIGSALISAIRQNPNDASSYPAIDPVETSLDSYQNIIIVTPLWWSNMAAIMQSYLFQSVPKPRDHPYCHLTAKVSPALVRASDAHSLVPLWRAIVLPVNPVLGMYSYILLKFAPKGNK